MDATQPTAKTRQVRCPHCGTFTVYSTSNPWRPFCSERCKSIDFGAWAAESYRVQAKPELADFDEIDTLDQQPARDNKPH
ncbi:MAG: DNA gyrase inhibitor YacG [Burkholderiaceae bacterium]|nr:DNA gyrase inhibitor YacG [Burkholderiaceae bacterium]